MKKTAILIIFTVTAILCLSVVPKVVAQSYTQVKAFRTVSSTIISTVKCSGTIVASSKTDISFGCKVKIAKFYVHIGDKVKKGQRLFDIDKTAMTQSLEDGNSESDSPPSLSSDTSNNVSSSIDSSSASTALKQALSSGVISQSTYNELINKEKAALNAASSSGSGADNVNQLGTEVLKNIESKAFASMDGIITSLDDSDIDFIPSYTTVIEISDPNSLQVKAHVDEDSIKKIRNKQPAFFTGSSFYGTHLATVSRIYPTVDSIDTNNGSENVVGVMLNINKPDKLLPGSSVDAEIKTSERNSVAVPYESIKQDENNTEYVFVFEKGRAVRKNISTGEEYDNSVEITKGIRAGDIVILNAPDNLASGSCVKIIK